MKWLAYHLRYARQFSPSSSCQLSQYYTTSDTLVPHIKDFIKIAKMGDESVTEERLAGWRAINYCPKKCMRILNRSAIGFLMELPHEALLPHIKDILAIVKVSDGLITPATTRSPLNLSQSEGYHLPVARGWRGPRRGWQRSRGRRWWWGWWNSGSRWYLLMILAWCSKDEVIESVKVKGRELNQRTERIRKLEGEQRVAQVESEQRAIGT